MVSLSFILSGLLVSASSAHSLHPIAHRRFLNNTIPATFNATDSGFAGAGVDVAGLGAVTSVIVPTIVVPTQTATAVAPLTTTITSRTTVTVTTPTSTYPISVLLSPKLAVVAAAVQPEASTTSAASVYYQTIYVPTTVYRSAQCNCPTQASVVQGQNTQITQVAAATAAVEVLGAASTQVRVVQDPTTIITQTKSITPTAVSAEGNVAQAGNALDAVELASTMTSNDYLSRSTLRVTQTMLSTTTLRLNATLPTLAPYANTTLFSS